MIVMMNAVSVSVSVSVSIVVEEMVKIVSMQPVQRNGRLTLDGRGASRTVQQRQFADQTTFAHRVVRYRQRFAIDRYGARTVGDQVQVIGILRFALLAQKRSLLVRASFERTNHTQEMTILRCRWNHSFFFFVVVATVVRVFLLLLAPIITVLIIFTVEFGRKILKQKVILQRILNEQNFLLLFWKKLRKVMMR